MRREDLASVPRQLRAVGHRAALTVANAVADIRRARSLLEEVDTYPCTPMIAVLADAGCGKTQLAAQLTVAVRDRPAGILLHGGDLHAGDSLDELARRVVIQGTPISSIEALVAAVDAAGQRAHRRPERGGGPPQLEGPLASLDRTLSQYPYVLFVYTVRSAFADEALPAEVRRLTIPDFEHDTVGAIRRYFEYYRISAADAELPRGLLSHPLTLRLFCEVTNPTRVHPSASKQCRGR